MKISNFYKTMFLIFFASILVGCSSSPPGGTSFIPGFNATWAVEGDADRQMDLQPNEANKNVPQGVFNGDEILLLDDEDDVKNPLSGSFNGLKIEFTIDRGDDGKVRYTGDMIPISETNHTIVRIDLTSSEDKMTLVSL